jgi:hypothetical protein
MNQENKGAGKAWRQASQRRDKEPQTTLVLYGCVASCFPYHRTAAFVGRIIAFAAVPSQTPTVITTSPILVDILNESIGSSYYPQHTGSKHDLTRRRWYLQRGVRWWLAGSARGVDPELLALAGSLMLFKL